MEIKEYIKSKKYYLKGLASQIRVQKQLLKESQRSRDWHKTCCLESEIQQLKYEFRHQHIVYCLVRKCRENVLTKNGKIFSDEANAFYYKIERTVKDDNHADWFYLRKIYDEYPTVQEVGHESALCVDA